MAAAIAAEEGRGLGEIVGREISLRRLKHRATGIFASAYEAGARPRSTLQLARTSSTCIPNADEAATGKATLADFHRLTEVAGSLSRGVVLNMGSTVIMPEVS